jgi:DNA helicase-2/ATP-dependent DNA helicase PcrA
MTGNEDKKLNDQQIRAIKYKTGPLLIIAGAGTGKTTVITERIKYLITKNFAKPSEILALTFTEKASKEMEERVDVAMPYGYTQMWISTFHSFCDRVLRREALHIGLDPKYKLNTQSESVQFIRQNLFKFDLNYFRPLGNPTKFISGMLQHFSRLQDEDITPNEYLKFTEKLKKPSTSSGINLKNKEQKTEIMKWEELSGAYKTYDELKVKEGAMDFGDLIIKTLKLFRERPNILREYRKQFKYFLVDEFQDTNIAQYELLKLLAPPKGKSNLTVVGDDSQSIYKFRGAAISNILYFKKDYKNVKTVVLTKNYRSTQTILDSAYKLIRHNAPDTLEDKMGIDKNLISAGNPKGGDEVVFIHKDRVESEAEEVAKEITNLIEVPASSKSTNSQKYEYKDIAILVRANNHSEPFLRALSRHGIPHQFLGPGRLFRQPEIVDLISYLRILYDFEDSVSMYQLLSIDYFNIAPRDLITISNHARKKNLSLFEAAEDVDNLFIRDETKKKINKILEIIEKHQKLIKKETAGQLLYYFLEDTGLIQKLLSPDTPEAERKALNISKFFDKLKTYEVEHEDATVNAVCDWIDLASELGESPLAADIDWVDINAVNILTAHSAKGLEFPVVFLVNLVSQRFPTIERREQIPIPDELIKEVLPLGDYHLEEERRLFYVGMTRAKDRLFFTAADYYGEGKREKKLSPFIFEALGDKAVGSEYLVDKSEQLSFLDYATKKSQTSTADYKLPIHIDYLSYSQIETFRTCPLHFKLKYIYKLPTPATSSQSFGNTFHITMKAFYEKINQGQKPTLGLIHKTLEENWINEGYLNKSHEKGSYDKAKRFLKFYLENYFDPKIKPAVLEQPFTIRLDNLRVGGKIDRVDVHGDILEIIDYKTGATPLTQKEAEKDLQLSIYGLAATSIPEYPFDRKPEKVKLSLMYFDKPQIVTTTRTRESLEEAKKVIEDYKRQIEESDFKCSHGYLCDEEGCEYRQFCLTDIE